MRKKKAIEKIAALAHDIWIGYSKAITKDPGSYSVHPHKLAALAKLWVPYEELPEATKESDRKIAERYYELFKEIQK
jgi:hypothetical protein